MLKVTQCIEFCMCICDRNGVKVVLGAGAVYITVKEGIWSTSESGLNAAQRLRTYVLPETSQYWDKVIALFMHYSVYLQQKYIYIYIYMLYVY